MIKIEFWRTLGFGLLHTLFSIFVLFSSIWLCFALWIQEPLGWLVSRLFIGIWIAFALSILGIYITQSFFGRRLDIILYLLGFLLALSWVMLENGWQ